MQLKKLVIVLLVLLGGGTCFAGITITTPEQNKFTSYLVDATVKVLTSCYGNQYNGLYGDSTGILFRTLMSKQVLPVILMDNNIKTKPNDPGRRQSRYKLQAFVVIANSSTQLQKLLRKIKNSPWWNHDALFLILKWTNESNHDCSYAFEFLWAAWEKNILNANFLCVHRTKGVFLYTYNPYTKKAPNTWKLKEIFRGKDDHPWSMFVQRYRNDKNICKRLEFDKTRDLGGYSIPATVKDMNTFWYTNVNKTGRDSFGGLEGNIVQLYFRAMNAEVKLVLAERNDPVIYTNEKGEISGMITDVTNGISDIVLNSDYQSSMENMTTSYPYWDTGIAVLTQYSAEKSQLQKINSVIDVNSRYGLYFVMLITPILFKCFMRQDLMPAILNTVRIVCNSCLLKLPKKTAGRIYLATLFLFQITILALYQGQLASLLTKPMYGKNINTMQDLMEHGGTIYAHKSLARYFTDPIFKGRFVSHKTFDCRNFVLSDSSAVCLGDYDVLSSNETISKLHLSKEPIIKTSLAYAIREDWPIEQRFNDLLARMTESGIIRHTYTKKSEKLSNIKKINEKMRQDQKFQVITLKEISFAFAILGIGLGCATVTFIVEILIKQAHR